MTAPNNWFDIYHKPPANWSNPSAPPNLLPPISQGPPAGGPGGIPGGSDIIGTGTIPGYGAANTQLSDTIKNLLNPNDAQANYDVTLHGAERSIAGGIPGSGLGEETTGRLRQSDIERRSKLGSELLFNQEHTDLLNKVQSGQLTLEQLRLALQEKIQTGQLGLEAARLLWNQASGGHGGGSGGGTGAIASQGGGQPNWRYGSGSIPPLPDDPSGGQGWSDINPAYTVNPYTNPESPMYAPAGQGFDYSPYGEGDLFSDPVDMYA